STGVIDFQMWSKNYQFWVKTDANGNFTIPHVLPGIYNIYAFGPGSAGQMTKTAYVTVTAGNTASLGNIIWVPTRTAPTIWEVGIPDRSAKEFKHGTDWWTSNTYPNTHWAKFMDYPDEFPNDVNFTIGQSNIVTDWNFVQNYDNTVQATTPEWKVKFNLTTVPTAGANTAAIYAAFAAAYSSAIIVKVNGTLVTSSTGTFPPNQSDAKVRKGIHGAFGDLRFTFNGNLLKAGANEISFSIRNTGGATIGEIMYDYVRLEAAGTSLVTTLPVTLQPLTVVKINNSASLNWSTLTEQNNNYFEVQQSTDGINFTAIGKVLSKGNSSVKVDYTFTDTKPNKGLNYYRLKQVDNGGKVSFSNIVTIEFSTVIGGINIYPNPASDFVTLDFYSTENEIIAGAIINVKGNTVKVFTIATLAGRNIKKIQVAGLANGNYIITLNSNSQILSDRFVKL
ncbi:MAG: T9SS type A sorting domain-containing protein, partial [Pedobacter sp.]|nr:T9SS type A sorting domain-containing protein [Chitinophagaceae bacterium]